jgi:SAM-dependent methyltransferase
MSAEARPYVEIPIARDILEREQGHCWIVGLGEGFPAGDTLDEPRRSTLLVLENGTPLGPAHAVHDRIRTHGRGLYSHWNDALYFSTSDNSDPTANERPYIIRVAVDTESRLEPRRVPQRATSENPGESPLFPRLAGLRPLLEDSSPGWVRSHEPAGIESRARIRLLEAKVEYLLDELYESKAALRVLAANYPGMQEARERQLQSFNFQWRHLPYHDMFLTNEAWRAEAADDVCRRLNRPREWFAGKRILDCGCGPGRHAWAFATLGAKVSAFDMSEHGLADARKAVAGFPDVLIEARNILDPLPYPKDFDLVWSYGVVHVTGDTYGALRNIAGHVAAGGLLYIMVYAEPERHSIDDYVYQHQVRTIRRALAGLSLAARAEVLSAIQGQRWALSWFDAISSEINDLYTMDEIAALLHSLGFEDVIRTMPDENMHNVIATRRS